MTEPPTKVYEPKVTDRSRLADLAQSNAPIRIYQPAGKTSTGEHSGQC